MGYFLLFESMLDSLIFARDKFLNKDGIMLPNECNLFISGVSDTGEHKTKYKLYFLLVYYFLVFAYFIIALVIQYTILLI